MRALRTAALVAVAVGGVAIATLPASAGFINLSGGTAGSIPDGATNEMLGPLGLASPLSGFYGTTVTLTGSSPLLVEFLGYEAGYSNTFTFAGDGFSTETDDPSPGGEEVFSTPPSYTTGSLSGVLDFIFATTGAGGKSVTNDNSNPDNSDDTVVNFFASIVGDPTGKSGKSVYLFFDDTGAGDDDNHDDMVVRISAVPLPASLSFLLAALAGLGLIERKRRVRHAA